MSYWSRSFPGLAECLADVRRFTEMVVGDKPGAELLVLAASELAGNAIQHTASGDPGGQFVVHIAAFADRWQVRVDDAGSPSVPHIPARDGTELDEDDWEAECGRGLALVAAVSHKWGVLGDKYSRAVWAEIPYPCFEDCVADTVRSGDASVDSTLHAVAAEYEPVEKAVSAAIAEGLDDGLGDGLDGLEEDGRDDTAEAAVTVALQRPAYPGPVTRVAINLQTAGIPRPIKPERYIEATRRATFQRALVEIAHAETLGPRPPIFWPPFPNPRALQAVSSDGE